MKFCTELDMLAQSEDALAKKIRSRLGDRGHEAAKLHEALADQAREAAVTMQKPADVQHVAHG